MRYLIVLLIVAGAVGFVWYAFDGENSVLGEEVAAAPAVLGPGSARREPAGERVKPVQLVAPSAAPEASTAPASELEPQRSGRATLEGTLIDRFGTPVPKERVFLLAAAQGHPPIGSDLSQYVTAVSSRTGRFSLSLPGEGPWRLGVGAPGSPRIPPSDARSLTGTARASIVLPGATALRVEFDEMPEGDAPVTLEFLTLVESGAPAQAPPGAGGNRRGRGEGGVAPREGRDGGRTNRGDGTRGGRRGNDTNEGGGRRRGGARDARDARAPLEAPRAAASSTGLQARLVQDGETQEKPTLGANRGGRNRRNQEKAAEAKAAAAKEQEAQSLGPPAEVWRAQRRHLLTAGERDAGRFELRNLPAGPVARLALTVGDERFDGAGQFTLQADVVTEVRVLPLAPGSGTLSYIAQAKPLAHGEAPPGVRWND